MASDESTVMESEEQVRRGGHKTASQRLTSSSEEIDIRWMLLETEHREHGLPSSFVLQEDRILYQVTSENPDWISSAAVIVPQCLLSPGLQALLWSFIPDKSLWAAPRAVMSPSDHQGAS